MSAAVRRPLDGVRIADFSQLIAGPSAAVALGDLGAEVTKIERIEGDLGRSVGSGGELPSTFLAYNRGKRSIALDLSRPAGRDVAKRMIEHSDVVIEGFRPGVMDRWGLGYNDLREGLPTLIYASVSAFAADGSDGERAGVDAVIQAESGVMAVTGPAEGPPYKVGFQVVDGAAGLALAQAILAALIQRDRYGEGTRIRLSLFEVAAFLQSPIFLDVARSGAAPTRPGNTAGHLGYPTDLYATSDGGHVMVAAYFATQWPRFCEVIGASWLADDPRFDTNERRLRNHEELRPIIAELIAKATRQEWEQRLRDGGVIAGPVRAHKEILEDDRIRANGRFARAHAGDGPGYWVPRVPYAASAWSPDERWAPPELGAHTAEVLRDVGYDEVEVAQLTDEGIVYRGS